MQKLGSSSLFITLPKKWINKWNIKPGDKVIMELESSGSLRLTAEKVKVSPAKKSIRVDVDSTKQQLHRTISCLYSLGYDEIVLESKKSFGQKEFEEVMSSVKQMVGMEVTEIGDSLIRIDCLLDSEKVGVESLLRRMLNIVAKQIDDLSSFVVQEKKRTTEKGTLEELKRVHYMLSRRIIGKREDKENGFTLGYLALLAAQTLMTVTHYVEKLEELLSEVELSEDESHIVRGLLQKVNDVLDEVVMSLIFPSYKRINNGFTMIVQSREELKELKNSRPEVMSLHYVLDSMLDLLEKAMENSSCGVFIEGSQ
ncbi:AbrB family transcriptional regulator [Sulfodiicoccus acidiphilus]|uniref:AbrB family transcriptional regulator n=1 Tax=Sulfodiicoccus acidiphilus TaxID=1670455 RepID=A0A348B3G5_9CREN|nr:AbrB family transcriptional regulator [Sulfodiicoccus acidiphilus]